MILFVIQKGWFHMSNNSSSGENKMGVMPINKLLVSMSLPIAISMLIQALYNIIDSIFVAKINENAFTALSLAFPIQNLIIAVSVGTGVGMNALLSRSLGEKNQENANRAAINGIFVIIVSYILFAILGMIFSRKYFQMQTSNLEIIEYGTTYLTICTVFSLGAFMSIIMERLLQATGNTFYSMLSQSIGAIVNIILDPIMIFGLFGFPKMGVAGAALATVIGQFVSMFIGLYYNITKNKEIQLKIKNFKPDLAIIKSIYAVGLPSIIMQSIGSVMTYGMNKILLVFSSAAVSVFGVYFKLQSFVFMPVFGISNGMIPIVAYNYGAEKKDRIMKTAKLSIISSMIIMVLGLILFQLFPGFLLNMFNASDEMYAIGAPALRIISVNFIFAGFSIIVSGVFQSLGNGVLSLLASFARQIIFILPMAYIFSRTLGLNAVWYSIPLAEFITLIINVFFFKYMYNKKIKTLGKGI